MSKVTEILPPIHTQNISLAWGKLLQALLAAPGGELSPVMVSLDGFDDNNQIKENSKIREELDKLLSKKNEQSIDTVAYTIFPQRLWKISKKDRAELYRLYRYSFINYRKNPLNKDGLYFERLMMTDPDNDKNSHNQLEYIINRHLAKHAKGSGAPRMQMIASIHDPKKDHNNRAMPGFPCLQQVNFFPTTDGYLIVNANYATQQLFRKAYGNFLGLLHLSQFMASQMKLKLAKLNITVGVEKIGSKITKTELKPIAHLVDEIINNGT